MGKHVVSQARVIAQHGNCLRLIDRGEHVPAPRFIIEEAAEKDALGEMSWQRVMHLTGSIDKLVGVLALELEVAREAVAHLEDLTETVEKEHYFDDEDTL